MDDIGIVRRFNRTYTPRIGALDDSFLGSGLPLGAARLLFEIGPQGAGVLELRRRLGLDSGYLSRLLRSLESAGLVEVTQDPDDRRRRACRLTPRGRRRWTQLDDRSNDVAAALVAPLDGRQRERLVAALATADLVLRSAGVTFESVDPSGGEATEAMRAYFAELDARFPTGFDSNDALGPGAAAMSAPTGTFLLARADAGAVAGCGGVQRHDDDTGEIKRMWIDPAWRGGGLGRRLLGELERRAAELGYRHVVLDTNATLTEAVEMYRACGYSPIERYNDNPYAQHWFAKPLPAGT